MFENAHAVPINGINRRRGIVSNKLTANREIDIDLRKELGPMFTFRWEINLDP